jgi:hypothetical protein
MTIEPTFIGFWTVAAVGGIVGLIALYAHDLGTALGERLIAWLMCQHERHIGLACTDCRHSITCPACCGNARPA